MDQQPTTPATPTPSPAAELQDQVRQLRVLLVWLGLAVLIISGTLTAYVIKQNRNLITATRTRTQQSNLILSQIRAMTPVLGELAQYSLDRPELIGLFKKYGVSYVVSNDKPAAPTQP